MTDFRTSRTTLEIDAPHLRATQLVARPGGLPAITVPMTGSGVPDVDSIWQHLAEPAEFFGLQMPGLDELSAAITIFTNTFRERTRPALVAASVTVAETDHAPQILVTGSTVQPVSDEVVRIAGDLCTPPLHRATDPWWRRMAARTTSRGEADQCQRWLNADGFADALSGGEPLLGALVFEVNREFAGVENAEPTSVLDQLAQCGAIAGIGRVTDTRLDADRVWWVSPRYGTHPVVELDGTQFPIEPEIPPPFVRLAT